MINPQDPYRRHHETLLGRRMAYVEEGKGIPVLMLSGTGTYSYYWRNLIRYLAHTHRCIAPDWMGTGDSDLRVPSGNATYRFEERNLDLDVFTQVMALGDRVVLIGHEMGALHAINWAARHPRRVAGLVLIEGVFRASNADQWDPDLRTLIMDLRTKDTGEHLALEENAIIERYLPMLVERQLTKVEMEWYRAPFPLPGEARRAPLSMLRDLPIRQDPGPLDEPLEELRRWVAAAPIPKLVIGGLPGHLTPQPVVANCARWEATEVATVRGLHYLMEDSPAKITALVQEFLSQL